MDYIIISEDITDKYAYYNESFYIRHTDAFGVVYVPIEDSIMMLDEEWTISWLDDLDIAYNSELKDKTNG